MALKEGGPQRSLKLKQEKKQQKGESNGTFR